MNRKVLIGSLIAFGVLIFLTIGTNSFSPQYIVKAEQSAYKTGWDLNNGKWYYYDNDGYIKTGWLLYSNKWYYLDSTGQMKTGWLLYNSKWYYLKSDGTMAVNTVIDGYKLGSDGAIEEKVNDKTGELLRNGSFAVQDGGTIFYDKSKSAVFKSNADGTSKTKISNASGNPLAVVSGYLYFENYDDGSNLYKIKTDGTNLVKLSYIKLSNVVVDSSNIYYIASGSIYRMDLDGNNKTLIAGYDNESFILNGEWIYFVGKDRYIYKIKTDGTCKAKVSPSKAAYQPMYVVNDWIYYNSQDSNFQSIVKTNIKDMTTVFVNKQQSYDICIQNDYIYYSGVNIVKGEELYYIYSIKQNGSERTQLTDQNSRLLNVVGEWIYYTADSGKIYRMKLDGSGKSKLTDDRVALSDVYFIGDWIYYINQYNSSLFYRMKADGSSRQLVN